MITFVSQLRHMNITHYMALAMLLLLIPMASAQDSEPSILSEFDLMVENANRYKGHRVVPIQAINAFRATTKTTLDRRNKSRSDHFQRIDSLTQTNARLIDSVAQINKELLQTKQRENQIKFLFWQVSKMQYNLICWSLILGLLTFLLVALWRRHNMAKTTKDTVQRLEELTLEFDQHRQRGLEREQVLRRKLQDELNKQKNT